MTTLYCGMMAVNGPEMFTSMDAAFNNGAEGISIFTINGLRSPEIRSQFKAYTDSVRAERAAKGPNPTAVNKNIKVNSNPFENKGIMKLMHQRMQKYTNGSELNLSDYKLVDEYGATKCYEVTEQNSGKVFDVKFYFYGGIISGWSVEPKQ
jgi:hypothetical protein